MSLLFLKRCGSSLLLSFNTSIVYYNSGIEHAELKRMRLFHHYHQPAKLLFGEWSQNEHLFTKRLHLPDRDFVNMYDYFQHARFVTGHHVHLDDLPMAKHVTVTNVRDYKVLHHGNYQFNVHFFGNRGYWKCVRKVECFYNNQCYRVDYYDIRGFLCRRMYFNNYSKKESSEEFLTPEGQVAIKMKVHHDQRGYYFYYYVWGSSTPIIGENNLITHFLNLMCLKYGSPSQPVIFVVDRWRSDAASRRFYHIKYPHYTAFYAHCSHTMDDNHAMTADTDMWFQKIFRRARLEPAEQNYDAIICSTPRQSKDIRERYQLPRDLFAIPVGIQNPQGIKYPLSLKDRPTKQITCVTRISPVEGVPDTIKAFCIAQQSIPGLRLDIYGKMGPINGKLVKQLYKLKRQYRVPKDSLKIHEYTSQVPHVYRQSRLTLVTSSSDSFNVSLLEALSQGCPAIVYNDNYGPRDMIHNGVDGYTVANGDYKKMAKLIIYLFQHPELMQNMSHWAYQESQSYSPAHVIKEWKRLIKRAHEVWPDKLCQ